MREKEARETLMQPLGQGADRLAFAQGYLEAIEKTAGLEEKMKILAHWDGGCDCDNDDCMFSVAKKALIEWERKK